MAKRRRKLSPEMEKEISLILKKVELITALINDINDEELQGEYIQGFDSAKTTAVLLKHEYDINGLTEVTQNTLSQYKILINKFEADYEL